MQRHCRSLCFSNFVAALWGKNSMWMYCSCPHTFGYEVYFWVIKCGTLDSKHLCWSFSFSIWLLYILMRTLCPLLCTSVTCILHVYTVSSKCIGMSRLMKRLGLSPEFQLSMNVYGRKASQSWEKREIWSDPLHKHWA